MFSLRCNALNHRVMKTQSRTLEDKSVTERSDPLFDEAKWYATDSSFSSPLYSFGFVDKLELKRIYFDFGQE